MTEAWSRRNGEDLGKALLRVAVGGMMLLHGQSKLAHGVQGISERLVAHGIPALVAYGCYLGEVVAPVMLILGIGTRVAGAMMASTMVMAIWLVHAADVFARNPHSGAWAIELPMLYLVAALATSLVGAGRWSLSRGQGRWD